MLAMNWLLIGIAFFAVGAVAVFVLWLVTRRARAEKLADWPVTEATIQSLATVSGGRGNPPLDVGNFSYIVNDDYYAGMVRISRSFSTHGASPKDLINKKVKVRYNPRKPEKYSVVEDEVGGFLIDQYDGSFADEGGA
ncbi:MAG TPA: DUF3592 domain-containing protein [Terracidiphilus sp.]|nr:DUF3592 domain-containing protein [Terracidiphilus sp.]